MHLILNGCQPSCRTNYFKTIVSFGIDATAQVTVPCQWHIQLKQLWIRVLGGLLCLVQSYQSTKNNLGDFSAYWFHCQVVWTCCTFPGFLRVFSSLCIFQPMTGAISAVSGSTMPRKLMAVNKVAAVTVLTAGINTHTHIYIHIYMYDWVTLLYSRNWQNTVNQLQFF